MKTSQESFFSEVDESIKGKTEGSITFEKTFDGMTIHDQGQTGLCWDYAAASSIRKSLLIKIGKQKLFALKV